MDKTDTRVTEFERFWKPCWGLIVEEFDRLTFQLEKYHPHLKRYDGADYNMGGQLFTGYLWLQNPRSLNDQANCDGFEIIITCCLNTQEKESWSIECDTQYCSGPILSEMTPALVSLESTEESVIEQLNFTVAEVRKFIANQTDLTRMCLQ